LPFFIVSDKAKKLGESSLGFIDKSSIQTNFGFIGKHQTSVLNGRILRANLS